MCPVCAGRGGVEVKITSDYPPSLTCVRCEDCGYEWCFEEC